MANRLDPFGDDEGDPAPGSEPAEIPAPQDADAKVEAALYRRAVGTVTWSEKLDRFGEVRRLEADVLPDPAAARVWLERRNPERWADKRAPDVRVIVARLGVGSEREAVGIEVRQALTIEHDPE